MLKEKEKLSKTFYIWFLIILLAIALVAIIYLMQNVNKTNRNNHLIKQRNELIIQKFEVAKNELKKYKGQSEKLNEVIEEATQKIKEKEDKIRLLLTNKELLDSENERLTNELDSIKEKYLDSIDSLLVSNQLNNSLNNTLNLMSDQIDELSSKLKYFQRLDVENLIVKPLRINFMNNEAQTALAKRTVKIKICFDVMDSKVTESGMKNFYIRILTPNAEVLSDSDEPLTFEHPELKQEVVFTMEEVVNYKNQKMNVCVKWEGTERYQPGLYIVELFTKENKLATSTFTLN